MKRIKKADKKAQNTPKQYHPIYSFNKNIFFASFIALIPFFISIIFIPEKQNLTMLGLNSGVFYFISLVFSVIIFFGLFLSKKPKIREANKYLFLFLILYSIGISFLQYTDSSHKTLYYLLFSLQKLLIPQTIIIGIISLWQYKTKLNKVINQKFTIKNQNIKIQIQGTFSTNNLHYLIVFLIVIGISGFTLFQKLENFDVFSDEVQVTQAATGYYHTGEYKLWDFITEKTIGNSENRAKPHQWIIAQSYKLFGINLWAARFPSAFSGLLLIILLFFIGKYFIKDTWATLATMLSLALYFEFLFLGRWVRMYGMVFPLFLIAFYWLFVFLNNNCTLIKNQNNSIAKYFNFKYIILIPLFPLLYLNLQLHKNTAILFPIFLVYSAISAIIFIKEKKYLTALIVALLILTLQIINPWKEGFSRFTFFEINHSKLYLKYLFGYPFSVNTNIIILALGFSFLFFSKNKLFRKRFIMLFVISILTLILFGSVFDFAPSYRYVSFITPITILLIIGSYIYISKILFGKYIQYVFLILIVASVGLHFANNYDNLYVTNSFSPAKPSIAHKVVVKNFRKGDVVFRHYGPKVYLKGIEKNTKFYELGGKKGKDFLTLLKEMKEHNSGWLIWHKYNEFRFDKRFVSFANLYFKKYTGYGIDSTGEEIFYYTNKMIKPLELFNYQQNIPTANLYSKNTYSLVFDLKGQNINETIFTFINDSLEYGRCYVLDNDLIFKTHFNDSISFKLDKDKITNVVLKISSKKISFYSNEKKKSEKNINFKDEYIKFKINPSFRGYINNIRIYNSSITKEQLQTILNDKNIDEELSANGNKFRTLYLWKRK